MNIEQSLFIRWNKAAKWESNYSIPDREWKHIAEPVMQVYTETTDGSFIEAKESGIVWHYLDADHDFGSCQAKELVDHLERVLSNEPVGVKCGHFIVEVKPQVYATSIHFVLFFSLMFNKIGTNWKLCYSYRELARGLL
jgi:trehalose 6-phosphate synthase/phosphatase